MVAGGCFGPRLVRRRRCRNRPVAWQVRLQIRERDDRLHSRGHSQGQVMSSRGGLPMTVPLGRLPARRSSHTSASVSAASCDGEVRGRREASRSPSIPAAEYLAFHDYTTAATPRTGRRPRWPAIRPAPPALPVPLPDQPLPVIRLLLIRPHGQTMIQNTDSNCQAHPDYKPSSTSRTLTQQRYPGLG
jgi:hypothetical protein